MKENKELENYLDSKIDYHFLKTSLQRCSADLSEFAKESKKFSDEQLFKIVAFCDYIKNLLEKFQAELSTRIKK